MKSPILPISLAVVALTLHTSCKPKPEATPAPTPEATATPAPAEPPAPAAAGTPVTLPPQGNNGGNRPGGGGNFQQRAEERMQRMKTELGLTDEQEQKVRAIYEQNFGSLRQTMGDQSMSREDRRAAFEKARTATTAAVEQILTPEQKPKWEAYQQEMEQRRAQGRRQGGGGNN